MSRSTRSSASKQQTQGDVAEDNLMEDGFSVVDTDHKKGKRAEDAKANVKGEAKEKQQDEKMDTDQAVKSEPQSNGTGNDAPNTEHKTEGEEAKEEETKGEEKPAEGGSEAQPAEGGEPKEGDENKEKTEEGKEGETKTEKKPRHPVVWVSNISRHVKATDLKKHFSKHGKVVTAKIVTNGRNFFGYVCLDSLESAETCVKNLHESDFDGKKILVTVDKPVRDENIVRRRGEENTGSHKDPLTTVYDDSDKKSTTDDGKKGEKKRHDNKRKIDTSKMSEEELRREVSLCEREIDRLRNRLMEEQSRCRAEVKRARRLEHELADADAKIREDHKRYDREREEWVKKNRLEQLRLDADRVMLEREQGEMRRAREEFERELRRFIEDQHRAAMERERPMPPARVSSPPTKRFRPDESSEGKGGWINESPMSGPPDASKGWGGAQNQSRGSGQFFGGGGGGGGGNWSGNQSGGSQWRNVGAAQPYFRNDTFRPGGGFTGPNDAGPGGFRSGPFENNANRKF